MSDNKPYDDDSTLANPDSLTQEIETTDNVFEIPEHQRKVLWGRGDGNRPVLVEWQEDNTPGRRWVLETDDVTVGRDEPSDLVIHMDEISRSHLRIFREGDHYFAADLGSKNGTWVNGERIKGNLRIKDGDEINVALVVKLIFLGEDSARHTAS
jgi:pSer/pThr/pTyr-binding forkhead associated (FHA) protein